MVYVSEAERVSLYGGASSFGTGTDLNDIWAYDLEANRWREIRPSVMPPPAGPISAAGPMAYDSQSKRVIVFQKGETWAYDSERNTWENMRPSPAPPAAPDRRGTRMAYDAESDRIILFGGRDFTTAVTYRDTWAYDFDSNTWTEMRPANSPSARHHFGMAYDSDHDRIIVFGGALGGDRRGDTWAYDFNGNTWTLLDSGLGPSPRGFPGLVYDSCAQRLITFGGVGPGPGDLTNGETWSYEYAANKWTQLDPGVGPSARAWHWMVYVWKGSHEDCDDGRGRTLLFGGAATRFGPGTNDLWTYDSAANEWTLVGSDD
jgi:hypothetical protein